MISRSHKIFAGLSVAVCALLVGDADAATWNVPDDFEEIHDAVDQASSGDTILVGAGTYSRRVRIENVSGLTIEAAEGAVLCPSRDDGIRIRDASGVTIRGLRIDCAKTGIRIDKGVQDVTIIDCKMSGA